MRSPKENLKNWQVRMRHFFYITQTYIELPNVWQMQTVYVNDVENVSQTLLRLDAFWPTQSVQKLVRRWNIPFTFATWKSPNPKRTQAKIYDSQNSTEVKKMAWSPNTGLTGTIFVTRFSNKNLCEIVLFNFSSEKEKRNYLTYKTVSIFLQQKGGRGTELMLTCLERHHFNRQMQCYRDKMLYIHQLNRNQYPGLYLLKYTNISIFFYLGSSSVNKFPPSYRRSTVATSSARKCFSNISGKSIPWQR